jgi:hypothetical protein
MSLANIEQAISLAADSKSDADYLAFFGLAKNVEFFFNVGESNGQMTVPLAAVGNANHAVIFYSSKAGAGRHGKYAGVPWEKGLEMVERMSTADGLIIQNDTESWIAITREKIVELLEAD